MKSLKLKNFHLLDREEALSLPAWLMSIELKGDQSRNSIRFVRLIEQRYKEVNNEKAKITEQYVDRDSEKRIIYLINGVESTTPNKGCTYKLSSENIGKVVKEFKEYLDEDYIIDITPATKPIIDDIKNVLLKTEEKFKLDQAMMYAEWCDAFEKI